MKKQRILAMAMVMGLAGSMTMPVEAARVYTVGGDELTKGCIIVNGQVCNLPEANNILKDLCDKLQSGNWSDCPVITLPDCNQPSGDGNQPEVDNGQPEVPDFSNPDGDTNQPETDNEQPEAPEAGRPDGDMNKPEMDNGQLEDNISDSVNPDTDGDTNQPETDDEQQEESAELSYARQVAKLVNEERAKAGLHPLSFDAELASAAQIRANEIKTSFSHTRPDGRKFSSVLTDNGIRFTGAGENIAWGQKSPEHVMEAWMNSDGHRANILNAKFTKIGVGQYRDAAGRNYWVQLFTY